MSELLSQRDLEFLLFEWLDSGELLRRPPFQDHSRETVAAALQLAETLATETFAPHNRANDLDEPTFDGTTVRIIPEVGAALQAFADAGFAAAPLPERAGGVNLPQSIFNACMAWFHAANPGTSGYALLSLAAANLLVRHGDAQQFESFVRPLAEGRFFGTMALSEPHAGSSLADITTRAEPQDDGTYRLFGQKMWISGGDHEMAENIVHLVLARTPGAPRGSRGISLFVVPKYVLDDSGAPAQRNDVALAGINHKMGFRGTVNAAPVFGDGAFTPDGRRGAVGYLVGDLHRGLSLMFSMMNEARIGVGLCATALGYTGYLKSLRYARERHQGRPIGVAQDGAPVLLVEHPDVRRMLLAQKSYAEGALALNLYCARLVDDIASNHEAAEAEALLGLLTPIAKSWPSQWCLEANSLAIQVLGGSGYTRDHDVEQHYRDNRLNPIHEGTHGIQAIDLLGRKTLFSGGGAWDLLHERIRATCATARSDGGRPEGAQWAAAGRSLWSACDRLAATTERLRSIADPTEALADATTYLEAAGHIVVAWLWLDQALATGESTGNYYRGKRAAARYFLQRELPKVGPMLDLLDQPDRLTIELDPDVL